MDAETVDQNYAQLQQEAATTTTSIQSLAGKLQSAASAGDPNAREWLLDLKEITLNLQQQQGQVSLLLQSIHAMINAQAQGPAGSLAGARGGVGGGGLQRFLGGGMGRAIMSGAGFGIGDDLINHLF